VIGESPATPLEWALHYVPVAEALRLPSDTRGYPWGWNFYSNPVYVFWLF
jgi:hypothetical protein